MLYEFYEIPIISRLFFSKIDQRFFSKVLPCITYHNPVNLITWSFLILG